jgi:ketosteroid isomerase-like protein
MATSTKARSAEEVARSMFDALRAHDLDGVMANWSEDGIEDVVPLGIFRGRDEIRENVRGLFAGAPDLEATLESIVADESKAVMQWRASGTFTGEPFNGIQPTGGHIELRFLELMEVDGGLVVRNTVYYDAATLARQMGMLPEQESGSERAMIAAFNAVTKVRTTIDRRKATA